MPPFRALAVAVSIVLSSSSLLADVLEITPPSPDATQNISIRLRGVRPDSCIPSDPRVSIENRTIVVRYRIVSEVCLSVLTPYTTDITIGPIAPGIYTVIAIFGTGPNTIGESSLVVREASNPFRIFPQAISTAGGRVVIQGARGVFCESGIANCDTREVLFGDKRGTVDRVNDFAFEFTVVAPPHAPGPVDVTVKYPDGSSGTARAAFRYFDAAAPPDPALFERVLLPVTRDVRGAFGSDFRVALSVYNGNQYPVPLWRPIGAVSVLAPAAHSNFASDKPNGTLVLPLRGAADRLYFSSNARDVSRVAETFGTEVRVVREKDARVGDSELVSVPADPNFRLNLRIYGTDSVDGDVQVALYSPDNHILFGDKTVHLTAPGPEEPAFAMIPDLRAAFPGLATITSGFFRIHVQGSFAYRYWPLLTVTNNTTQQVTTVTPQ